jgi:hypothetical protein
MSTFSNIYNALTSGAAAARTAAVRAGKDRRRARLCYNLFDESQGVDPAA